ncbi:uncharacterized protein BDV14DRAFT_166807 [Aspergillus stella-maris]|uniref:uncharacterized protein n=1 Tax=Aspergillus stella-maris TaxID=1810926 RepID=UPI003CCE2415
MSRQEFIMVLDQFDHQLDHNGVPTVTQSITSRPTTVVRKKFAKPPVKVACLACRSSRTRCDGQDPCANCLNKKRKCSYLPSKRGGPRKKKKHPVTPEDVVQRNDVDHPIIAPLSPSFEDSALFGQIDLLSAPAAGLRALDFSSDVQSLFAGLFVPNDGGSSHVQMEPTPSLSSVSSSTVVRTYGSEQEILNAYYAFIHDYFPILPPKASPSFIDRPLDGVGSYSESPSEQPVLAYQPRSPLSAAMAAVLVLIPHPNDPEPSSPSSVIRRRTFAHTFTQMANANIESDCELHASPMNPFEASHSGRPLIDREFLHPHTPVGLESLLALLVLSVYEYTQRGNLLKMRYRAGQALAIALDMRLHALGEEHDEYAEARRRAWWMTYYCVLQGSIVTTTPLSIDANDSQFVTPYPRFAADPDGWSILIQSQQILVTATQFVIDLKKCMPTRINMSYIYESMQRLDAWASTVLAQSALPASTPDGPVPESTTAQSIRAISQIKLSSAQIKIHRFRAFSDIPIFLKRHCDLTKATSDEPASESPAQISTPPEEISSIGCSCSSLDRFQQSSSSDYAPSSDSSSASSEFQALPQYSFIGEFPFTSQHSASVCLKASLLISRMFQSLPLPQPVSDANNPAQVLQLLPQNQYPRTMPSFACCLMQGSYALLMIFYQLSLENQASIDGTVQGSGNHQSGGLTQELRQGLERIITAVSNYTISFEALNGMKDDIQGAYDTAFLQG